MGMIVDGFDVSDIGIVVREGIEGWKDGFEDNSDLAQIPNQPGGKFMSPRRQTTSRTITVPLFVEGSSNTEVKNRLDELKFRLHTEPVTVQFPDADREFTARLSSLTTTSVQSEFIATTYNVQAIFNLADPRLYSINTTTVDFSSGSAEADMGTAIVHPTITLDGVSGSVTIGVEDPTGTTLEELTLNIGSGQRIIDMLEHTIEDSNGNNKLGEKTGGRFFGIDPQDGSFGGPYPKLTINASPTTAEASYQKAYI